MKEIVEVEKCVGCGVCVMTCPKNAIIMEENKEGFKYPVIDEEKCVNCNLCKKNCPIISKKKNLSKNKCYAAFALDKSIREQSSSGGLFTIFANYILDNGGIVIGAAFDNSNNLNHIAISSKDDINRLRGSKYLQSNTLDIFEYIKAKISLYKILFVGTPCQVAALRSFLKNDYENLYCIDLFCHGVPSPKVYRKYVLELEKKYNSKIVDYNFRDKKTGWVNYSNTIKFKDKSFSFKKDDNDYMNIFLSDISLRKSCYNCNFKLGNKYSDITLGDFWGIDKISPNFDFKSGVSAVIINNSKGEKLFDAIKKDIYFQKYNLDDILLNNSSLVNSAKITNERELFFANLDKLSISALRKKYSRKKSLYHKIINKISKNRGECK